MRIEQLQFFIELVKSGSVSAASKKLYMSQQTLTYNLKSLEDELGFILYYYRTKGEIALTKEGKIVYSGAQSILARHQKMMSAIQESRGPTHNEDSDIVGGLVIHASPMISISILSTAYLEFMNAFPRVQVFCMENYQNNTVNALSNGLCDVGYILVGNTAKGFFNTIPDNVELELLNVYQIYMAMSLSHPLAQRQSLSLDMIRDFPLVIFEVGGPNGEHALKKSVDMKVDLATNNHKMCFDLLRERNNLLFSFEPFIKNNVFSDFVHRPLDEEHLNFHMYVARRKDNTEEQNRLIDCFNAIFKEYL